MCEVILLNNDDLIIFPHRNEQRAMLIVGLADGKLATINNIPLHPLVSKLLWLMAINLIVFRLIQSIIKTKNLNAHHWYLVAGADPGFPLGRGTDPPGYDFAKFSNKMYKIEIRQCVELPYWFKASFCPKIWVFTQRGVKW